MINDQTSLADCTARLVFSYLFTVGGMFLLPLLFAVPHFRPHLYRDPLIVLLSRYPNLQGHLVKLSLLSDPFALPFALSVLVETTVASPTLMFATFPMPAAVRHPHQCE